MKKKKSLHLITFLGSLVAFAVPALALAQTLIDTNIPGTNATTTGGGGPGVFVANFYQFALIIGGVLAFGVIVYGGVKYMISGGNPSGQSDAKEWIESALLGLLLLAGAYFVLNVINPQLLNLTLPTLTSVSLQNGSTPGNGSNPGSPTSGVPGAKCQAPPAGPCSTASLQGTCLGSNAATAAGVCNVESSDNNLAGGDLSTNLGANGKGLPASVGLFQINLSANTINGLNCPSAFSNPYTGTNPHTTITNMTLYNQCVAAAENPNINIAKACSLSKNGTNWKMWGPSTLAACGL